MSQSAKRDLPDSYYAPWWVWMPLISVFVGEYLVLLSRVIRKLAANPRWGEAGAIAAISCIICGALIIVGEATDRSR